MTTAVRRTRDFSRAALQNMKVSELKAMVKYFGVSARGNTKEELVDSLMGLQLVDQKVSGCCCKADFIVAWCSVKEGTLCCLPQNHQQSR